MDEWRVRLRSAVAGWDLSAEEQSSVVEELEQHLEQELAELRVRVGDVAARESVLAQVSDPALRDVSVRARHQPAASVPFSRARASGLASVVRDVRYGWRALRTSPGTTALAMVALALGIGLTTVMFSILYGTLLRGLPYEEPDRIMLVMNGVALNGMDEPLPMHELFAYRDAQRSFETFGAYAPTSVNLGGGGEPVRVEAARVTSSALSVTRVRPMLGRAFGPADEASSGALVVLLSYALWRDSYASDSNVVGRVVRVNQLPATVVGVMPEGFVFPNGTKLWVPLRVDPESAPWGTGPALAGVARLRAGVTLEQANVDLAGIAHRIATAHPSPDSDAHRAQAVAVPFVRGAVRSQVYSLLYAMFVAVGLVFLVACINVANLLLGRAAHRSKEVAIRSALGASRVAIARQFLVEAVVLSVVSAGLGAVVAQAGIAVFRRATADTQFPFWTDIRLHPQVFVFIALAAVAASLVSGLIPAITAARGDITDVLKDQSLGSSSLRSARLSRGLVVFELALSAALLMVAALATESVLNLRAVEPGFRVNDVLTARVTLTLPSAKRRASFLERMESEVARLPGVTAAALSTDLPGTGWSGRSVAIEGRIYARAHDRPVVRQLAVTPGFFKTFDVSVVRGRAFTAQDRAGAVPVVVVNQRFVMEHLAGADPLGRRIDLAPNDSVARWATIVGVIPNLYVASFQDPWPAEVLTAYGQEAHASASIAVRTDGDPAALARPLRAVVASLDRDVPVYSVTPMRDVLAQTTWPTRVFGGLFVVFSIVALALASIGLYAVLAFSVSRREREMGIRLALGAAAADVVRLVFRDGAVQLGLGVTAGLALGVWAAGLARSVLFGVAPSDPVAIGVVAATLAATGCIACVAPAWRAAKADPVRSLRAE